MNLATQLHGSQVQWDPRSMGTNVAMMTRGNKRLEDTQVRYTLNQKSLNPKHLILLVTLSTTPSLLTATILQRRLPLHTLVDPLVSN